MNSLGIEYGSSSSEDEGDATRTSAPAPQESSASAVRGARGEAASSNEAPCVQKGAAGATPELGKMTEDEGEAMLLRAGIPPASRAPSDSSSSGAQERIAHFLRVQRERGQDFQSNLQTKKEVRNPYILEKVVEYFGIDELQSNFSPDVFDPSSLPLHEFTDALALEQKKRSDARVQRQRQQSSDPRHLQFVSSVPPSI